MIYLPSAGLVAIVAVGLRLTRRATPDRVAMPHASFPSLSLQRRAHLGAEPGLDDEVTLWRSAVPQAPASAKAHGPLPKRCTTRTRRTEHRRGDRGSSRSVALLDALPDEQNTFQAFRQAGAYYVDKANAAAGSGTSVEDLSGSICVR